jgi:anti-anti-sigma regulatory factor
MAHRELTAGGGGLAFAGLSQHARDLFQLAGLQDLFVIEDSVEKAERRLF